MANQPQKKDHPHDTQREQQHDNSLVLEAHFAGPLPPPGILQGYEDACPGAADRILSMAEKYGDHQRRLEERAAGLAEQELIKEFAQIRFGQVCGLVVSLAFIVAGAYIASQGHSWQGALLGGGGVGLQALVATFIGGKQAKSDTPDGDSDKPPSRKKRGSPSTT